MQNNEKVDKETQYYITAYREVGEKYRSAIGVQKFVWTMFHGTHLAYLTFIFLILRQIDVPLILVSALLIIITFGIITSFACARQLKYGHQVIQRTIIAGIELEWKIPELGSLYRNNIQPNFRKELWKHPKPEKEFIWEPKYLDKIGVRNTGPLLCCAYAIIYILGGSLIIFLHINNISMLRQESLCLESFIGLFPWAIK